MDGSQITADTNIATESPESVTRSTKIDRQAERELIAETKAFVAESKLKSWWVTLSSFAILGGFATASVLLPWWPAKIVTSVLTGLMIVRCFILFHDHQHGALLWRNKLAKAIYWLFGVIIATPPTVWRETHNYHHAHTAKIVGSHVGSFMMLTVDMYKAATPSQKLAYRLLRNPMTIVLGYFTIFLWGMCGAPFLRSPKKHPDALLSLIVHFGIIIGTGVAFGPEVPFLTLVLPMIVACAMGGYLFYAQHNFPGMHVQPRHEWTYGRAALESSSFFETGPVLGWFTGNIGYHHVHHLNPAIPFYRLPEAMAALPALQNPVKTSLRIKDVWACLRLKLWDPEKNEMVPFPEA